MNVKWIIGRKTFTVLALLMVVLAVGELLTGDLLTAILALIVSAYTIRDAQENVEVQIFDLEAR
jgi:formate/nitrite transporter FocA (FNT family)